MADITYNRYKFRLANKTVDYLKLRVLLLEVRSTTVGADENPDLTFVSDLTGVTGVAEFTGTNYARQPTGTITFTQDDTNNWTLIDCPDIVWANLGIADGTDGTVRAAVIYEQVGADDSTPADDPLVRMVELTDTVTNGQNLTVTTASGIFRVS